ncbi:hypothetical protein ABUL04_24265 [Micromonospora harpali]|uniref:NACHT domain-containing protein n=1 Tax=Micromonospora harpali TaxID=1490225 RepID=A0ABW1HKA8_9ACTN
MFFGGGADSGTVGNSNVVGGFFGAVTFALAVIGFWPRAASDGVGSPVAEDQVRAAVRYLARETLAYWREQAKARRIMMPAPARVSWRWASPDVAVPVEELAGDGSPLLLLSDGLVSRLRREVYEVLPEPGRVVILGGPGAGKTATMLLLLIDVLTERADAVKAGLADVEGDPVPVWLTLGGWNPNEVGLLQHAAMVLNRNYPGLVAYAGPGSAAELLRAGRVALFLDGLDEMPEGLRGPALERIDQVTSGVRLVLTSRPDEFRAASRLHRLWNAAVIELQPIDVDHACDFLLFQQTVERRREWQKVTDHMRDNRDGVVAETLRIPLALSLARDTYTHTDAHPADLLTHETPDGLLKHLLTRLLQIAYPSPNERAHAVRWLSWIAENLNGQRDIRWWDIPVWMTAGNLRLGPARRIALWLAFGSMVGLVGRVFGPVFVFLVGPMFVLFFGLLIQLMSRIDRPPAAFTFRGPTREQLGRMVIRWLVSGLLSGFLGWLVFGFTGGSALGLTVGLTVGLVDLMNLWKRPLPETKAVSPVEVHSKDFRGTVVVGLMVGLVGGQMIGLMVGFAAGFVDGLIGWLFGGLMIGILAGFAVGVGPAAKLAWLECLWALRGTPVRFIPLLQSALERQVLRQAGAVYQFRHAALQDLLAPRGPTLPSKERDVQDSEP